MHKQYWLHVEDLVDAYIGPFDTPHDALAHYDWTKNERHDGAVLKSISDQPPPQDHPLAMTAAEDRATPPFDLPDDIGGGNDASEFGYYEEDWT